jgi:hypothetical protein
MWPAFVTGYPVGESHRFAIIFDDDAPAGAWKEWHDLTLEQYQRLFDEWRAKGYRPASVCGYCSGDITRFAAVFVENKESVSWEARSQLSAAE